MYRANKSPHNDKRIWRTTLLSSICLTAVGVALLIWVDTHSGLAKHVPAQWTDALKALIVLIIGGIISAVIERGLFRIAAHKLGPQRSTTLRYLTRLLLFITVAISVMTAFGVGIRKRDLWWHIFDGDYRIGRSDDLLKHHRRLLAGFLSAVPHWRFDRHHSLAISGTHADFPHEATRPMYYGRVLDINLMYTQILNQDGYPQLIPNGIIAQSFIENRSETGHHRIRLRFDVSYDIDAAMFTCKLKSHLENEFPGGSGSPPEVGLADIYPTAYSVIVSVYSTEKEEQVRNKILFVCVDLMQSMRKDVAPTDP